MKKPDNCLLIIFGASGDLTYRKLIPALYDLQRQNLLPDKFSVVGVGRTPLDNDSFREKMNKGLKEFIDAELLDESNCREFIQRLHYVRIDTKKNEDYLRLAERLTEIDAKLDTGGNYIFYLATPPGMYTIIPKYLAAHNLSGKNSQNCFRRIIIEKPFGTDYASAAALNKELLEYFDEKQIYRIDHYLGKETAQNILVTRFSNGIFEPLWNRNFIRHIEITSSESLGIGDRGGYYDESGALRDMLQNHLLQLTALTAMEPPSSLDSNAIRNETLKIFQSLRPLPDNNTLEKQIMRGQYLASSVRGEKVRGYRDEHGVKENSKTETYAALKFYIDNWRWGGVPFYIRTGKRLPTKVTEVVIHFKKTPHHLFALQQSAECEDCNMLIIRIQPDEGILLKIGMKVPGAGFRVQTVNMDFHYSDLNDVYLPSAYERLLYDCMAGDSTLYIRGDALEACWKFVDPILTYWKDNPEAKLYGYPAGTWGPENADRLIEGENVTWRYPCRNLSDDGTFCLL